MQKTYGDKVTDIQLEKLYNSLFGLKCHRKKLESCDIGEVVKILSFCTMHGCIGMGIGWEKNNPTVVNIKKSGIEFDFDGKYHSFKDIALQLVEKYGRRGKSVERR